MITVGSYEVLETLEYIIPYSHCNYLVPNLQKYPCKFISAHGEVR